MRIYKKLYTGERASKEKRKIIRGFEKKLLQPGIYAITLPSGEKNLLDILPAFTLKYDIFRDKRQKELCIVGIAKGRSEAFDVVARIVEDTYSTLGNFDIKRFLNFGDI